MSNGQVHNGTRKSCAVFTWAAASRLKKWKIPTTRQHFIYFTCTYPYVLSWCSLLPVTRSLPIENTCRNIFTLRAHRGVCNLKLACGPPTCPAQVCPIFHPHPCCVSTTTPPCRLWLCSSKPNSTENDTSGTNIKWPWIDSQRWSLLFEGTDSDYSRNPEPFQVIKHILYYLS